MSNRDFFNIECGSGRYDVCGRLANSHTFEFLKIKNLENEGIPEIDEQLYFESYDSLKIAKKKVLKLVEEGQISQGIVVDTEIDKIVWLTREK